MRSPSKPEKVWNIISEQQETSYVGQSGVMESGMRGGGEAKLS